MYFNNLQKYKNVLGDTRYKNDLMQEKIKTVLRQLEKSHQIRILYACESGSRAWGFPSPDSDYDVRFIYVHPTDWYLSINEKTDYINLDLDDGLLDLGGWDIRKTLNLYAKSNASVYSWIDSPIVYQSDDYLREQLHSLQIQYFTPKTTMLHYLGITKKMLNTELQHEQVKLKKYFYVIRPLLCARWIVDTKTPPPMEFHRLLPLLNERPKLLAKVHELLKWKETASEQDTIERQPIIHQFVEEEMTYCYQAGAVMESNFPDKEPLNQLFREVLQRSNSFFENA